MRNIFFANVGIALVMIALAVPLVMGRIKPNALYGFRTPKKRSSDAIWYPANRFAGIALIVAGVVTAAGSIVLYGMAGHAASNSSWSNERTVTLCLGLLFVPLACSVAASFFYLRILGLRP